MEKTLEILRAVWDYLNNYESDADFEIRMKREYETHTGQSADMFNATNGICVGADETH